MSKNFYDSKDKENQSKNLVLIGLLNGKPQATGTRNATNFVIVGSCSDI